MLGFLKKYQKIFFVVVALLVGVSVMFVGLLPRNLSAPHDPVFFKTVAGEKIKRSQFEGLKALLTTNNGEMLLYGNYLGFHFFPEDVFTQNIVQPNLIKLIAEKKADEFLDFWKEQHQKEQHFKTYVHPQSTLLSAEYIWQKHAPQIPELIKKLQQETDPKEAFKLRAELFAQENQFSSYALWQFLMEQQRQYQWLSPDENMEPLALSLFGYRSLHDWFGEKMIDYVCQFICQVSSLAKKKGYQATYREAENSLMALNEQSFKQLQFLGLKEFNDADSYFHAKLTRLGMNKAQIISLWQEILTFQNILNEAAHTVILDDFTLNGFEQYASEQIELCRYKLPNHLNFKSLTELAKFEAYLTALGKKSDELNLDFITKPIHQIENENPQLIEQKIEIQFKELDLQKAAISISVQDVWNWKFNPANASSLKAKFPKLEIDSKMNPKDYQAAIESVDYFTQIQMDQFVREFLFKKNENWLSEALEKAPMQIQECVARKSGYKLPFKGLEVASNKKQFLTKLFDFDSAEQLDQNPITFDNQHYYQVVKVQSIEPPRIVEYKELLLDKTADKLLHQFLSKMHKNSEDKDKDFSKVKEKFLKEFLKPIQKAICDSYDQQFGKQPGQLNDYFYCEYRFFMPMKNALEEYKKIGSLQKELVSFNIESFSETLIRQENNTQELEELLSLKEGEWTDVQMKDHSLQFAKILRKNDSTEKEHPMQKKLRQELASESIKALAEEFLEQIELKNYSNLS